MILLRMCVCISTLSFACSFAAENVQNKNQNTVYTTVSYAKFFLLLQCQLRFPGQSEHITATLAYLDNSCDCITTMLLLLSCFRLLLKGRAAKRRL